MFFRLIFELLLFVVFITVVRSVIGIVMRALGNAVRANSAVGGRPAQSAPSMPRGGELKMDPVCGTYTPAANSFQKRIDGQTYYFCSKECREKFVRGS